MGYAIFFLQLCGAALAVAFAVSVVKRGHVTACVDLVIGSVLLLLATAAAVLEIVRWVPLFPVNMIQRRCLRRTKIEVLSLLCRPPPRAPSCWDCRPHPPLCVCVSYFRGVAG